MNTMDWRHVSEQVQSGRLIRLAITSAMTAAMTFGVVSCGDDDDGSESDAVTATDASNVTSDVPAGEGDAVNGEDLARSRGCAGCHGQDFSGGAGPTWVGLAGSEVELSDGGVVVADTAYLVRAIADPGAESVADYTLRMPANSLTDDEIADIVAFIEGLADA